MKRKKIEGWKIVCFIYLLVGIVGLIVLIFGCNPVKKVEKDSKKELKVVQNYLKKNPVKNDTTIIFKPGDTVRTENVRLDTIFKRGKDSISYATITKTIVQTKIVRDTILKTIESHKFEQALQKTIEELNAELIKTYQIIEDLKKEKIQLQKEKSKWRLYFFLLVGANTLYLAYKIKSFFTPKISI